jgi:predicted NBD/HSP70 family sugar kinase
MVIRRLINNGWLRESGRAVSLGGRRPVQLRLASGRAYIAGLEVCPNLIRTVLMDADGSVVNQSREDLTPGASPSEIIKRIVKAAEMATSKADAQADRLLGVGISLSGVVYSETGTAQVTPGLFNWESVDITTEVSKAFKDKLISVDNNARTRLGYEIYNYTNLRNQTVLLIDLNYNIGGALAISGSLYQGVDGAALDLAHLKVCLPSRPPVMMEEIVSEPCILNRIKEELDSGFPSLLRESLKDNSNLTIAQVMRAAQAGDQLCYRVISEVADAIGDAVANLANMLRPKTILFAGDLVNLGSIVLDTVKRHVRLNTLPDVYENLRLAGIESDEYASALGSAHLVLDRWLTDLSPSKDGALHSSQK